MVNFRTAANTIIILRAIHSDTLQRILVLRRFLRLGHTYPRTGSNRCSEMDYLIYEYYLYRKIYRYR